ncbi:hypothetical protein [Amycolatopsis sp. NPDC051128]
MALRYLDIRDLDVVADGDVAFASCLFDSATGEALTRLRPDSGTAAG